MASYNYGSVKSKASGPGASLRITPSNSPILRPGTRSPKKSALYQSTLSLETVIGTTTTSTHGFSSHETSRSFAFCAGSAAVLAKVDDDGQVTQRFFRARPTATGINPAVSFYNPCTPPTTPETRKRRLSSVKSNGCLVANGSPSSDWGDSNVNNSPRTWSSRDKVKAVSSVAISPNGRFLALGETGYNPRVLIFSTANDSSSDIPLTIINEHSFGVRGLAFSSNSQYLATLGDVNDGFLFVWAVNLKTGAARLHSANKCTAFVRSMCWLGQTLITVGIRHVKVWRLPEVRPGSPNKLRLNADVAAGLSNPGPRALSGRNCLLGSLGDCTFTCAVSISDFEALLGTDTGALCLLNDTEGCQMLSLIEYFDFSITSLAVDIDQACVWLGGRHNRIRRISLDYLRLPPSPATESSEGSEFQNKNKGPAIICMGFLSSHLATIDAKRAIHLYPIDALSESCDRDRTGISMPAHRDPVLGIGSLKPSKELKASFFTWSSGGAIKFWDTCGKCHDSGRVELEQVPGRDDDLVNELKVVRTHEGTDFFFSGDRLGVLRVLSRQQWKCIFEVRAHGGEITDIAIQPGPDACFIASSGRDRMVQLFMKRQGKFELAQTMDDHVGAVGQVLFANDGQRLLSCSADRTVLVRDRVTRETNDGTVIAYVIGKVIRLKASPASMTLAPDDPNHLILSTIDRCIQRFELGSGRHIHSFRASDPEMTDAVVMGSLKLTSEVPGQSPRLLVGVSSTDKSLRIFDFERDSLLTKEFAHTEGVSDVIILDNPSSERMLVTAGIDGVVMIWNLSVQPQPSQDIMQANNTREHEETPVKELTVTKPPLRRILSKNDLASFQRKDNSVTTPTPGRAQSPPSLRKKLSKYSLMLSAPKIGNAVSASPPSSWQPDRRSPTSGIHVEKTDRSPSPSSPKTKPSRKHVIVTGDTRHVSADFRRGPKHTEKSEFGSLNMSTEQVCRTLRAYRKKLNGSSDRLNSAKELERELGLTLRVLDDRTKNLDECAETETDSSGKETRKLLIPPPKGRNTLSPRRMPSSPNFGLKPPMNVLRSRSLDDTDVRS